jgi:hypothetical protein
VDPAVIKAHDFEGMKKLIMLKQDLKTTFFPSLDESFRKAFKRTNNKLPSVEINLVCDLVSAQNVQFKQLKPLIIFLFINTLNKLENKT